MSKAANNRIFAPYSHTLPLFTCQFSCQSETSQYVKKPPQATPHIENFKFYHYFNFISNTAQRPTIGHLHHIHTLYHYSHANFGGNLRHQPTSKSPRKSCCTSKKLIFFSLILFYRKPSCLFRFETSVEHILRDS